MAPLELRRRGGYPARNHRLSAHTLFSSTNAGPVARPRSRRAARRIHRADVTRVTLEGGPCNPNARNRLRLGGNPCLVNLLHAFPGRRVQIITFCLRFGSMCCKMPEGRGGCSLENRTKSGSVSQPELSLSLPANLHFSDDQRLASIAIRKQ